MNARQRGRADAEAPTVLICDGAAFLRGRLAEILRGAGYQVVGEAATGAEAVFRYRDLRPDLMTLDLVMPEFGGLDAIRAIVEEDPEARILMCSAVAQRPLVDAALRAGARGYIGKPFHPAGVLEAVHRALM